MPTYDFRCAECDHRFSDFVNIKDKDSVRCPKCGGNAKQLFTGFLFISKGRHRAELLAVPAVVQIVVLVAIRYSGISDICDMMICKLNVN